MSDDPEKKTDDSRKANEDDINKLGEDPLRAKTPPTRMPDSKKPLELDEESSVESAGPAGTGDTGGATTTRSG